MPLAVHVEQVARTITHPNTEAKVLTRAAAALAAAGQPEQATQLVGGCTAGGPQPHRPDQPSVSADPGGGDVCGSRATGASRAGGPHHHPPVPAGEGADRRGGALAAVGQQERAEQVARSIPDPGQQAEALVGIAAALARSDENSARSRSQRVAAQILATDSWYRAMPVLASLDSVGATSIGTAILDL